MFAATSTRTSSIDPGSPYLALLLWDALVHSSEASPQHCVRVGSRLADGRVGRCAKAASDFPFGGAKSKSSLEQK